MSMLIAHDAAGNVIATLDHMAAIDQAGDVVGLIDIDGHEQAGGRLREVWKVPGAAGSGTWPEWIGARAFDFTVELVPGWKRGQGSSIAALVHKLSGQRRDRAVIEQAIAAVPADESGRRDVRHLIGSPDRLLRLDDKGATAPAADVVRGTPPHLPLIGG